MTDVSMPPGQGPPKLREELVNALRDCYDPEIPVNIVDLGLIYGIDIVGDGDVVVRMTMTSVACPAAGLLVNQVETRAMEVPGVKSTKVDVVHDPPWGPDKITEEGRSELLILGINIPKYN
jgi:metal-sulfur cluster biosynthetic enzyme